MNRLPTHFGNPSHQHAARDGRFNNVFRRIASTSANAVGSKWAFIVATVVILAWAATGPIFHYSDTWQLVINTGTTIITFLMVFLIQNTQNRDAKAIHLKLDELIRGVKGARTNLVDLETLSDDELEKLHAQFKRIRHIEGEDDRATGDLAEQEE